MQHSVLNPFRSHKFTLKNRAVVSPMSRVSTSGDGVPTAAMAAYYERYAAGGFGMVITEGTYTDRHFSQAYPNQPGITDASQKEGWRRVVAEVKKHDTIFIMQLMHAGALSQHLSNTRGPSAIQPMRNMLAGYSRKQGPYPLPHAMNLAEIDQVVDGYVQSALAAEKIGFNGVEIHAANGYLLDQFLTEYTNNREDKYGGSVENRIRLTAEIIAAIKQAVKESFIVGVRLSQGKVNDFDYLWPGGIKDGKIIFNSVANAGADYIHFASEGKGFDPDSLTKEGQSLPKLARECTALPVIANGGLHDPAYAERIIADGHGDIVSHGKGALANPDWPNRLYAGDQVLPFDPGSFEVRLVDIND